MKSLSLSPKIQTCELLVLSTLSLAFSLLSQDTSATIFFIGGLIGITTGIVGAIRIGIHEMTQRIIKKYDTGISTTASTSVPLTTSLIWRYYHKFLSSLKKPSKPGSTQKDLITSVSNKDNSGW